MAVNAKYFTLRHRLFASARRLRQLACFGDRRGQAAVETAIALPLLVWLLYYTINAFQLLHTYHIGQKYAAMNMYQRLDSRAKFVIDSEAWRLHGKDFMGVQYTDRDGNPPKRNIVDAGSAARVMTAVGICKEPGCN